MKRTGVLLALLCCVVSSGASPCDATYYLQDVTEYVRTVHITDAQTERSFAVNDIDADMAGIAIVDTHTVYRVISRYTPVCNAWTTGPVRYRYRPAGGAATFSDQDDTDLFFRAIANLNVPGCGQYSIAFSFKSDTLATTPSTVIIGQKSLGEPFEVWYGAAVISDTVKNIIGEWHFVGSAYYESLYSYCDSAVLSNGLKNGLLANKSYGDTLHGLYIEQLLKLSYDTIPLAVIERFARDGWNRRALPGGRNDMSGLAVFDPRGRRVYPSALGAGKAAGVYLIGPENRKQARFAPVIRIE